MRFYILTLVLALLAVTALAVAPQKAVIVTYPDHTPESEIDKAMDVIRETGGIITHEYTLLKGFAAKASTKALEAVTAMGEKYLPVIEEDSIVSIDGDIIKNGHIN